jgi:hypothetical protein
MGDASNRIKAIRRLVARVRPGRAGEYLDRIAEIASGKGDLEAVFKNRARKPVATTAARKRLGGRDRKEDGGRDRGSE